MAPMSASSHVGVQTALVPAAITALNNGAIASMGFRGLAAVPLSVDSISSGEKTVWSEVPRCSSGPPTSGRADP